MVVVKEELLNNLQSHLYCGRWKEWGYKVISIVENEKNGESNEEGSDQEEITYIDHGELFVVWQRF